jgi:hypothetical protein
MSEIKNGQPDDAELSSTEALLPWYATGRLSTAERAEVEAALAKDDELARRLAIVRDEEGETISLNESLRTPPAAALDRLMAKIDVYEAAHPRRVAFGEKALGWLSRSLSQLSPQTLAWSATAAAVVICLQGGLLTGLLTERHGTNPAAKTPGTYGTASADLPSENEGTSRWMAFASPLSLQDMTAFLLDHHAVILEGPKPGGFYRIKIAAEKLSGKALDEKLAEFSAQKNVVSLILPEVAKP